MVRFGGVRTNEDMQENALKLWEIYYEGTIYAEDFHGNLMCRNVYGNPNFYVIEDGKRIYCGWRSDYILD